jgi:hypothetical protein
MKAAISSGAGLSESAEFASVQHNGVGGGSDMEHQKANAEEPIQQQTASFPPEAGGVPFIVGFHDQPWWIGPPAEWDDQHTRAEEQGDAHV